MGVKRSSASAKSSFWVMLAPLLVILVVVLGVLAVAAAKSGFRSPQEGDVAIGEAAGVGEAVTLPPLGKGKILEPGDWPSACTLVTPEDVQAILPEAEEIEHETTSFFDKSIREFAADPEWEEADEAEDRKCLYGMRLPGEAQPATQLWVRIDAIAHPGLIKGYYDLQKLNGIGTNQGARGADDCVIVGLSEGTWLCRKGPVMFSVGGQTTVTFRGQYAPSPFVWRDNVNPLIVETVASKIQ